MEDVILVSGVLYLRPPAGEGGEDGILCDGLIEFRNPAGWRKEETKLSEGGRETSSPEQEEDESIIDFIPATDEDTIPEEGSMG